MALPNGIPRKKTHFKGGNIVWGDELQIDYSNEKNLDAFLDAFFEAGDHSTEHMRNTLKQLRIEDPPRYPLLLQSTNVLLSAPANDPYYGLTPEVVKFLLESAVLVSETLDHNKLTEALPKLYATAKNLYNKLAPMDGDPVEGAAESDVPSPTEGSDEEGDGTKSDGAPEFSIYITPTQDTASVDETI